MNNQLDKKIIKVKSNSYLHNHYFVKSVKKRKKSCHQLKKFPFMKKFKYINCDLCSINSI